MEYTWQQMKTEQEILACARQYADQRGWPWLGRIELHNAASSAHSPQSLGSEPQDTTPHWIVRTNCDAIGCNIELLLNAENGSVIKSNFRPR